MLAFVLGAAGGWLTDPSRRSGSKPDADPSASGEPHEALAGRLPAEVYEDCRPDPEREGEGRDTSVKCGTPLDGADELLVTQWRDREAMLANFDEVHGAKPDGKCGEYAADPPTGLRSTWGDDAPLACFVNSEPAAILLWEYPERRAAGGRRPARPRRAGPRRRQPGAVHVVADAVRSDPA